MSRRKYIANKWFIAAKNYRKGYYLIHQKDETSETPRDMQVMVINYGTHPSKAYLSRALAVAQLTATAPELLREHETNIPLLEEVLCNPFLSAYQKNCLQAMINDTKRIIKKATE